MHDEIFFTQQTEVRGIRAECEAKPEGSALLYWPTITHADLRQGHRIVPQSLFISGHTDVCQNERSGSSSKPSNSLSVEATYHARIW